MSFASTDLDRTAAGLDAQRMRKHRTGLMISDPTALERLETAVLRGLAERWSIEGAAEMGRGRLITSLRTRLSRPGSRRHAVPLRRTA